MATKASRKGEDERVSLAPLTPEEALRALLAVKPDDEPASRESADPTEENSSDGHS